MNQFIEIVFYISKSMVVLLYGCVLFIGVCGVIEGVRHNTNNPLFKSIMLLFLSSAITALVLGVTK